MQLGLGQQQKKMGDIIDSSPQAIRSIGSYILKLCKKEISEFGQKHFERGKKPVNLVIFGVISTLKRLQIMMMPFRKEKQNSEKNTLEKTEEKRKKSRILSVE